MLHARFPMSRQLEGNIVPSDQSADREVPISDAASRSCSGSHCLHTAPDAGSVRACGLLFLIGNAVSVGPRILTNAGHLPRNFCVCPAAGDLEAIISRLAGNV